MNKEKTIKQLEDLAAQIEYHDNLYYNNDLPEISDAEYDKLRLQNKNLETQFPELVLSNSPSNRVGVAVTSSFKKVNHVHFFGYYIGNYPTLSLQKIKKICSIINSIIE